MKLSRSASSLSSWPSPARNFSIRFPERNASDYSVNLSPLSAEIPQRPSLADDNDADQIIKVRRLNSCVTSIMRTSDIARNTSFSELLKRHEEMTKTRLSESPDTGGQPDVRNQMTPPLEYPHSVDDYGAAPFFKKQIPLSLGNHNSYSD